MVNAAVFLLTSSFCSADAPAPMPAPVPAPAPVVSTGSACGGCAPATCDPCGPKTSFFDKIKSRFNSISFKGHGCGCAAPAPAPACEACKPAPVIVHKPIFVATAPCAAPVAAPCDACSAKPSIFSKIKGRLGCHKSACGCESTPVAAQAPCAGAVTTTPAAIPSVPANKEVAPIKEMPKTTPPTVNPGKVGFSSVNGPDITPVKATSPF